MTTLPMTLSDANHTKPLPFMFWVFLRICIVTTSCVGQKEFDGNVNERRRTNSSTRNTVLDVMRRMWLQTCADVCGLVGQFSAFIAF